MSIRKSVKILHKFFKKIGWDYAYDATEWLFRSEVQIGNGVGNVSILLSVHDDCVMCVSGLPQHVMEDWRGAVAELVCRVNNEIPLGRFDFDFDDGKLFFRRIMSSVELADDAMKNAGQLICDSHATIKRYGPAFIKVMLGACTPQMALKTVLDDGKPAMNEGDGGEGTVDLVKKSGATNAGPSDSGRAAPSEDSASAATTADDMASGSKGVCMALNDGGKEERKKAAEVKDAKDGKWAKGQPESAVALVRDYRLDGLSIRGDLPLGKIVSAVRNFQDSQKDGGPSALPDRPRMSLLLWGPPGTGKTEFVNYLGQQLGREVMVKMGGDVLDHYAGKTEKAIRAAFREAERKNAILFLDELDGLMQKRADATNGWEVTQVNELLACMERFSGVMVGATNLMGRLDPAVLRRFTYKVEFGYLANTGKRVFFDRAFKTPLTDGEAQRLEAIPNLTPGDFKTVSQKFFYLGDEIGNAERLAALEQEAALKADGQHVCRGFAA